jgi:poly-gamma-glutamate synthesis protein (capsule biosynthesis protein)
MLLYGMNYPFLNLPSTETLAVIGNFEAAVPKVHKITQSGEFAFSVATSALPSLYDYGFSHMSLANNHSYDFGVGGYINTKKELSEVGVEVFGNQLQQASSSISIVTLHNRLRVALVGVTAVHIEPTAAEIEALFSRATMDSDIQIAYVHWGNEYMSIHSVSQERLGKAFVDAGADMVIGHHPHVIQDVGLYKSAPIFYSLGNFIFDQYFSEEVQNGLALKVVIDADSIRIELFPVTSIGSRSQPRLMSAYERDKTLEKLANVSDPLLREQLLTGTVTILK